MKLTKILSNPFLSNAWLVTWRKANSHCVQRRSLLNVTQSQNRKLCTIEQTTTDPLQNVDGQVTRPIPEQFLPGNDEVNGPMPEQVLPGNGNVSRPLPTYTFDTHTMVKRLRRKGFTEEQAEEIKDVFVELMTVNFEHMNVNLVNKTQQEMALQRVYAQISSVQKDMSILERSEFSQLRHDNEKLNIEIKQLKTNIKDEIAKLNSNVALDLNLERARAKEAHQDNRTMVANLDAKLNNLSEKVDREMRANVAGLENKLNTLFERVDRDNTSRVDALKSAVDVSFTKTNSKIENEVATLQATYEKKRNDFVKYGIGVLLSVTGVMVAFYRVLKG